MTRTRNRPQLLPKVSLVSLAAMAAALVPEEGRAILGIAGAPGSGKTTLAESLVTEIARTHGSEWVAHLPMDGFHLADVQLERLGLGQSKGAPDTFDAEGYVALLRRIHAEDEAPIYAPGFDRALEQPVAAAMVVPPTARLVISEGNYLLLDSGVWPQARAVMTAVWFVTLDEDLRVTRLVDRHVHFGKTAVAAQEWATTSDQANADLIAPGIARADRVVVNNPDSWS